MLRAGAFEGAYYVAGYSVECALKACIAKQFQQHDIPERKLVNDVHSHDLDKLLDVAGLRPALQQDVKTHRRLRTNWNIAIDWKETVKYNSGITAQEARILYTACAARRGGVLTWLRKRW